jgi:glycosyltransferase involved in cell wall biosynthesis
VTRVAFVHDWLTGMRGGEKVLEVMCERFPSASLFTLVHVPGSVSPAIERLRPRTSFIQRLPMVTRLYRQYLPLFPAAVEQFDFDGYDVIVSVSHCCVKSIVKPGAARHLCYCLTPMRYAWDQFDAYFGPERIGAGASRLMRPVMARMARWDRDTAGRADRYVAISHYVAGRIRRYYNREATVVYPPVDTDFFRPGDSDSGHSRSALIVSALVPYKRIEVAIEACRLAGIPLTIAGDGPDRARLERLAGSRGNDVKFLGRVSDDDLRTLYQGSAVTILPGEEDFGIVPLEAQACGRPVVALNRGGAQETVLEGETGTLVDDGSAPAFADAIARTVACTFDPAVIRGHAERFSRTRFGDEMQALIEQEMAGVPVGVPVQSEGA